MSTRNIVLYPSKMLTSSCHEVEVVNQEIEQLIDDLLLSMYAADGVGLAAPQVGVNQRVIVIDISHVDKEKKPLVLINPVISSQNGEITWEEGCLSFPGLRAEVTRSDSIKVKGMNREGKKVEIEASGLLAVALQHEIDHLNGILFIDRLGPIKRRVIKHKMKKIKTQIQKEG